MKIGIKWLDYLLANVRGLKTTKAPYGIIIKKGSTKPQFFGKVPKNFRRLYMVWKGLEQVMVPSAWEIAKHARVEKDEYGKTVRFLEDMCDMVSRLFWISIWLQLNIKLSDLEFYVHENWDVVAFKKEHRGPDIRRSFVPKPRPSDN